MADNSLNALMKQYQDTNREHPEPSPQKVLKNELDQAFERSRTHRTVEINFIGL